MKTKIRSGFEEIPHTADWSIRVWAPDLGELLRQSAAGMQALIGVQYADAKRNQRFIDLQAEDPESLLVAFLNDLLFWMEMEQTASDRFLLTLDDYHLTGIGEFGKISAINKEIKAVTFHRLEIKTVNAVLETTIVFDV